MAEPAQKLHRAFARLAKSFRKHAARNWFWIAVGTVFILSASVFFFYTPRQVAPSHLLLDSIFRAFQLFLLNLDIGTLGNIPVVIYLLAMLAALLTFVGALAIGFRTVLDRLEAWRQARQKDKRAVLLGFGRINRAAARTLRRAGYHVTAADLSFDEGARRLAAEHGVLLVPADLRDVESLETLGLERAGRIVVALGEDIANVELGSSLIKEGGPLVFIHVTSVQLAASLRQLGRNGTPIPPERVGASEGRSWIFSLKDAAARRLLADAHLPLVARRARQTRVHLVIVGLGDQGQAVLLETLMDATAIDLAPPRITIIDKRAADLELELRAMRPRLFDASIPEEARPIITFIAADLARLNMAEDERLLALEELDRPTAYALCCGEDAVNLDAGLRLEQAMRRSERFPATIYLALQGTGLRSENTQTRRGASLLRAFANIDDAVRDTPLMQGEPDAAAIQLNAAYDDQAVEVGLMKRKDRPTEAASWASRPETMRESNRRAVRHARTKLLDLGFRWRDSTAPGLPSINKETALSFRSMEASLNYKGIDNRNLPQSSPEAALLAKSVLAEHRRWLIDRALDGWRQAGTGESRSNQRRIHDNIVPFSRLSPENKRFDAMFIRALLDHLSNPSDAGDRLARLLHEHAIFLTGTESALPPIPATTTDLNLAWSGSVNEFSEAMATTLAAMIKAWSETPSAAFLTIYLGRPPATKSDAGRIAPGAVIDRLVAALASPVSLEVIHAYGRGVSETDPGLDDAALLRLVSPQAMP